jgi:hypothetical protein
MNKLRCVRIAVFCAALLLSLAVWGADASRPAPDTATTPAASQPTEIERLKTQLELQQRQIRELQIALEEQKKLIDKVATNEAAVSAPLSEPEHKAPNLGDVASTTPIIPRGVAAALPPPTPLPAPPPAQAGEATPPESPLQLRIGNTTILPIGFIDATNTFRSTNSGASLATNFGNYPYGNTVGGHLTEDKLSLQNSRVGLRFDSTFKGFHVLGYWESDFVGGAGYLSGNLGVTSNSQLFRLRLMWVDIRKGPFEVLGGQSWSMMTPNRRQISPLPGDLFYGQEFDVNYLNGLTWGRIPGFRIVYHPSSKVTWGVSFENADQYFGGSGGGGVPTLPAALTSLNTNQIDGGGTVTAGVASNGLGFPNVHPDIISKIAFDPSPRAHFEIAGVFDTVRVFNPNTGTALGAGQTFTKSGGGGSINGNFEIFKNFRIVTNNFWSDGAGRYIFGEAPNFIIRSNGSPSLVHSGSTVDGFEWTMGKSLFYAYYGGIYVGRNIALDANGTSLIGYGYTNSANSQNRSMQEGTIGLTQTLYRDPKYGQVSFYLDYAYFWRAPWYVASGAPNQANQHAVWFDLRYTFPGSAPAIQY